MLTGPPCNYLKTPGTILRQAPHERWKLSTSSAQDERWKLIYHPEVARRRRPRAERWELYDLENDPAETRNLYAAGDRESRRLQRVLSDWMKGNAWLRRSSVTVEEQSDETLRALKALGYVQ